MKLSADWRHNTANDELVMSKEADQMMQSVSYFNLQRGRND